MGPLDFPVGWSSIRDTNRMAFNCKYSQKLRFYQLFPLQFQLSLKFVECCWYMNLDVFRHTLTICAWFSPATLNNFICLYAAMPPKISLSALASLSTDMQPVPRCWLSNCLVNTDLDGLILFNVAAMNINFTD